MWHFAKLYVSTIALLMALDAVWLGVLMSELIDNQKDKAATSGIIALQAHAGPPMTIQFKDVRLKELK